jgi:predicted phosphodiesterase
MKIQFCSDLHLEMNRSNYHLNKTNADVIVLAGDIHVGTDAIKFAAQESAAQNKSVVIVAGNHEFYGHDYHQMLNKMREAASHHPLVYFLENDDVIIDNTRFIGCTLWTDYLGVNPEHQAINMAYCGRLLRDHLVIRYKDKNFTPKDALTLCLSSKDYLDRELDASFSGKTVVVTHHGPSLKCQHKQYRFSEISTAFISDLDSLVRKADLWIYGHTHSNLDAMVGDCQLVSNQLGYSSEGIPVPFRANWVVEL